MQGCSYSESLVRILGRVVSFKLAFASIALGTSQRSDAHLSMRFIYDPTHHIAQVSKRIEDGAQEVADAAPRKAQAASDEIEGAAKAVADNARPAADQASEVMQLGAKKARPTRFFPLLCSKQHSS